MLYRKRMKQASAPSCLQLGHGCCLVQISLVITLLTLLVSGCSSSTEPPEGPISDPPSHPSDPPPTADPGDEGTDATIAWRSTDVGAVSIVGRLEAEADELRVVASGSDIWFAEDSFHFVYLPVTGDVDVRARVTVLSYTDAWAKAGVMIRESLAADAAHGFMGVTPAGPLEFIRRHTTGHESESTVRTESSALDWVRLVRQGPTMTAYTSTDGMHWHEFDSTELTLGAEVMVGIAVTSRHAASTAVALARDVTIRDENDTIISPEPPIEAPAIEAPPPEPTPPSTWVCPTEPLSPQYTPTMYVATHGSDSHDGRSPDRPLRSLQRAADLMQPGDVIWVRGGVYTSSVVFQRSGTTSAPIIIESHPGECAILDGTHLSEDRPATLMNAEHLIIRNLVIRNSPAEGIFLYRSHNNTLTNLRTHNNYWSGVTSSQSNHNLFTAIISHDNFDPPHGGHADGISISSGDSNHIDRCIVYNNSDDGVDTWRSTNTLIERCIAFDNGWQGGDGNGIKAGGGRPAHTIVRHSIAFNNRTNGFDYNQGGNVTFQHNTAFNNGRYNFVTAETTRLHNNISHGAPISLWGATTSHNSWDLGITDPNFQSTDPNAPDFLSLTPASPAINAGTNIDLPFTGTAPDLGALPANTTYTDLIGTNLPTPTPPRPHVR